MKNKKEIKIIYVPSERLPSGTDFSRGIKGMYEQRTNTIYIADNLPPEERRSLLEALMREAIEISDKTKRNNPVLDRASYTAALRRR